MKKILFFLLVLIPYSVLGEVVVPMEKQENGLYLIPCTVNGVPMKFIFDTGASSVNISLAEALFLFKNGHIKESDIRGTSHALIANGEIVENTRIQLRKIEIGGIEINDVDATVSHNLNAPLLLGQSAISKLGSIQLEGTNLIIKDHKGSKEQNGTISNWVHWGLIILIISVICYLFYIFFSKLKKHHYFSESGNLVNTLLKRNIYMKISTKLAWFESRKYIIYLTYCFILLLSVLVIELHIMNKRDKLYSELIGMVRNSFGNINESIDALDFDRIDDLEFEEVSIPKFATYEKDTRVAKRKVKQWNNMFSGIEHVYKITEQGWQMAGMQYSFIPDYDRKCKLGIQDYFFVPYMICVPDGLDFNQEIANNLLDEALNRVYCEPNQYNTASEIKSTQNEYFKFVGNTFLQDSLPEMYMGFYNKTTGTDPIYENNKFTGYYWFGMLKIGQYKVIFAYTNSISWRIEEKDGFNASTKDRVIYYSITFILLTIFLFLFLYCVKNSNRDTSH